MPRVTGSNGSWLISGAAAALLALGGIAPAAAQQATPSTQPIGGILTADPGASGANTYIGHVDTPRTGQSINPAANLLVSGWADDTTAQGWSGFDAMSVYSGARENGTKLADGVVGLKRTDIADMLGSQLLNTGFSAVVPASAIANLASGQQAVRVYLHTQNKGWWYRAINVNVQAAPQLAFPNDPVISIVRPLDGTIITQRQTNNKYSIQGFAFDRNPPGPNQSAGPTGCNCGISSVVLYMDAMPGMPGYTHANDLSTGNVAPGGPGSATQILVNNFQAHGARSLPSVDLGPGTQGHFPGYSYVTGEFGNQFNLSGWSYSINPTSFDPDQPQSAANIQPNMFHTVYVVATSSITGKQSVATTTFLIRGNAALGVGPKGANVAP